MRRAAGFSAISLEMARYCLMRMLDFCQNNMNFVQFSASSRAADLVGRGLNLRGIGAFFR